jgi:3-dehydroquinate synthase
MKKIEIKSSIYNYEVEFSGFAEKLNELKKDNECVFVIDKNVHNLWHLSEYIPASRTFIMDAVEQKKTIDSVLEIIDFFKSNNVRKNFKVICFGGGITQDVACFAGSIYLRNIEWYFFPTTLLAMCDSCIGGKCGVNYKTYKNQLGVFYPPKRVYIDTAFLQTLSKDDYINGWGEILKFSLTENKEFFEKLDSLTEYIPCSEIDNFIYDGLVIKKNIIEKDEFDNDLRRVLNYGHTFGHALEAYTNNEIPHGKGVIWGIDVVNYIAFRQNILPEQTYLRIKKLIKKAFIPQEIKVGDAKAIIDIIKNDKKVKNDTVYLALLDKISHLIIYPMKVDGTLLSVFEDYLKETQEYYSV